MGPTIFDRLRPSDIRTDPFPHAVVNAALPPDLCARLIETRPGRNQGSFRPATRSVVPAWMMCELDFFDPAWRAFAERHTGGGTTQQVRTLFNGHWPDHLPDPPDDPEAYGLHGRDDHDSHPVLCDARLETISPNPASPASHRGPHLDSGNRLFSALYYLRSPDDDSDGGGLTLFRFRNRPERLDVFAFSDQDVSAAVTIPYAANTLVVFPNRPDAIHEAEPRGPTPHDRAYIFVTAEVRDDLF